MQVPLVDLKAQYQTIKPEIDNAIAAVINETAFFKGKYLQQFEQEFARYVGVKHCIGCANGTDAIELALEALGVGRGDEVIVPANTFFATSEAVTQVGATPIFVDIDPKHYHMDPEKIEAKITPKTKAIIPVHLYGAPADMDMILPIARQHKLLVIEDVAQAHGARYKGKMVGTFGDAAAFSFFPGKNLGAYGDGGAVVVSDDQLARRCQLIGNHGSIEKYVHEMEGRNSRLDGIQAAVLSVKLKHLDKWNQLRRKHAEKYSSLLSGLNGITLPSIAPGCESVFHLYVIQLNNRDQVMKILHNAGIGAGIHYPLALPFMSVYKDRGATPQDYPVSHAQMNRILSLPLFPELGDEQIEYVVDTLKHACAQVG